MILGMELFNGNGASNRCSSIQEMANSPNARFCDGKTTMLVLFQILTTNDWHQIMYNTMEEYSDEAALYFCVYVFLGPMLMVFLLIAFVWDFYFEEFRKIQLEENFDTNLKPSGVGINKDVNLPKGSRDCKITQELLEDDQDSKSDVQHNSGVAIISLYSSENFNKYRVHRPNSIAFKQRQIGRTKRNEETLQREKSAIMESAFPILKTNRSERSTTPVLSGMSRGESSASVSTLSPIREKSGFKHFKH